MHGRSLEYRAVFSGKIVAVCVAWPSACRLISQLSAFSSPIPPALKRDTDPQCGITLTPGDTDTAVISQERQTSGGCSERRVSVMRFGCKIASQPGREAAGRGAETAMMALGRAASPGRSECEGESE